MSRVSVLVPRRSEARLARLSLAAGIVALAMAASCGDQAEPPTGPTAQDELQRATAGLTGRTESENFVFHFQPGDGARAEVDRSEAYHRWAVGYLGVRPPKKIDFYMFPSREVMAAAFGETFGGRAFPRDFAVATAFSWHNHECFHRSISGLHRKRRRLPTSRLERGCRISCRRTASTE